MARLLSGSGTIGGGATQAELDAFVGSTNIATLGTVGTGTWEGTTVAVNQGGTGAATHTANNVMIGAGTSALTSIAPGADGQVLTSTGSVWQSEAAASGTPDYDTDFPFTSLTQNFGKMRIIVGSGTAAASSSYFAASGLYYNLFTVTYSGFSDTPKIFMTIGGGSHETGVGAYYQVSTTSSNIYLNSRVSSQVVSQSVYYVLIGTAS